jgi:hypothetical protein
MKLYRFSTVYFSRILVSTSIFLISVTSTSCNKSVGTNYTLPPITQEGKNTFGCEINGKIWIPYFQCSKIGPGDVQLSSYIGQYYDFAILPLAFGLQAGNSQIDGHSLFDFRHNGSGPFLIFKTGNIFDSLQITYTKGDGTRYYNYIVKPLDTLSYFQVTKIDTLNKIISGIFDFTLYAGYGDSVIIKNGRFDFQIGEFSKCSK